MSFLRLTPSFGVKLVLLALLTSIISAVLVGGTLITRNYLRTRETALRNLAAQSDMLSIHVSSTLSFDDRAAAHQTLSALRAVPDVATAILYDEQGLPK